MEIDLNLQFFLIKMNEDFTGVIGVVYRKKPLKFLLILNQKTGNITFPAGGRETGEKTSLETLQREILEETGLAVGEYNAIKTPIVHEFVYNEKKTGRVGQKARQIVYLLETKERKLVPQDPDTRILGWFTQEEVVEKLTFEDSKDIFRKVLKLV